jgi:endonuclease YncB( thermonuclease family)
MSRALWTTAFVVASALASAVAGAEPASRVYLNGVPAPVYFNDGDSFRVLAGEYAGTKARLAGFNTLESYGSVHRWGDWDAKELYHLAKLATLNAQRGVWRCTSDLARDTYGRILWYCPDLAMDQVRRGLAHVLSIDATPGDPRYLAAQRDAIAHRRGIWAHGVPAFIMTSLHSADEGGSRDGVAYNRVVSTLDGHSASWRHRDIYSTCDWVCRSERRVDAQRVIRVAATLRAELAEVLAPIDDRRLVQAVRDFAHLGYFVPLEDEALNEALRGALETRAAAGALGPLEETPGSCVLHVPFETRFGGARAGCLK